MKENKVEIKKTKTKVKKKNQDPINNFKKVLITEKDNLNKSQKDFFISPRIKLGQR